MAPLPALTLSGVTHTYRQGDAVLSILRGADLTGVRFDGVDLVGCRLDGIRGAQSLRGVRMPWPDVLEHAGLFAVACGVQVLDA